MRHASNNNGGFLRLVLSQSIHFRYFSSIIGGVVLYLFRAQLPFPYPIFLYCVAAVFCLNLVFHIVSSRTVYYRLMAIIGVCWDIIANLFFILFSGGFLSPFILTSIISMVGGGALFFPRKRYVPMMYILFLAGYNSISLLQKFEIIPNYVTYAQSMMYNDPFFYFILFVTNSLVLLSYSLIVNVTYKIQNELNVLSNAYRNIVAGTASDRNESPFPALTHHLAQALTMSTSIIVVFEELRNRYRTVAIWHDGRHHAGEESFTVKGSVMEVIIEHGRAYHPNDLPQQFPDDPLVTRFGLQGLMGEILTDGRNDPIGIIAVANTKPLLPEYAIESVLKIFAARATSEIVRKIGEDEKKRMQLQLVRSQKLEAIGQLAGGIAHDFNNVISGIVGYAELIKRRSDPVYTRKFADSILAVCNRAKEMTGRLTTYARKGALAMYPVDIHKIVDSVVEMAQDTFDKRIMLIKRCEAARSMVLGDFSQLQNALLNLVFNARDAMSSGGMLTIKTELYSTLDDNKEAIHESVGLDAGPSVLISVSDTGAGMDEEVERHLFEPFFTTKDVGKGTGLGLSSVYGCVKKHKGTITVKSRKDWGTTFCIRLPLAAEVAHEDTMLVAQIAAAQTRCPGCVIIIDDNASIRESFALVLRDQGFSVVAFARGLDAIEHYRIHADSIDVVILDMMMPEMGGLEVFNALKAIRHDVKVLILSGYSSTDDMSRLCAENIEGFITKPYNPQDIGRDICRIIARAKGVFQPPRQQAAENCNGMR